MAVTAQARLGKRTKKLIPTLKPGQVAIIDHANLDRVSADDLARVGVAAVVNVASSVTGTFPNIAPQALLDAGIPVVEQVDACVFEAVRDGDEVTVDGPNIYLGEKLVASGVVLTQAELDAQNEVAQGKMNANLENFALNTVEYLKRDGAKTIYNPQPPAIDVDMAGRHALVVARGPDYQRDLKTLRSYIDEIHPVLIAVDGGADALLEIGRTPHVIVGDMDSVTDEALRCGAVLIAHAYEDGTCPSAARLEELGVAFETWALPATSEDLGLLLAWENDADLIVAVGTHSNLIEYMEKDRLGMASTFLVRLRVGTRLVDAKGVSKLYRPAPPGRYVLALLVVALLVIVAVVFVSEPLRNTLEVMWLTLMANLGI